MRLAHGAAPWWWLRADHSEGAGARADLREGKLGLQQRLARAVRKLDPAPPSRDILLVVDLLQLLTVSFSFFPFPLCHTWDLEFGTSHRFNLAALTDFVPLILHRKSR